jgi:hypothetical protein
MAAILKIYEMETPNWRPQIFDVHVHDIVKIQYVYVSVREVDKRGKRSLCQREKDIGRYVMRGPELLWRTVGEFVGRKTTSFGLLCSEGKLWWDTNCCAKFAQK